MPKLDLVVQHLAHAGMVFPGSVSISQGKPGRVVQVRLRQVRGACAGAVWGPKPLTLNASGAGDTVFDSLRISTPTTATFVASARDDEGDFYEPDAESVLVQP